MVKKLFQVKKLLFLSFVITSALSISYYAHSYVMPTEQILGFMVENFSGFRTVSLIQSTLQITETNEKLIKEQIWLESPDKYCLRSIDALDGRNGIVPDLFYRQLFMANDWEKFEKILLPIGIDLTKTSLTRLDGVIAYRIGDKEPDSPKLLVEKESFLPLLLVYRILGEADNALISVSFKDYQKLDSGMYPFEITYKAGDDLTEKYIIQNFQANIPVDAAILSTFPEYELPELPEAEEESEVQSAEEPDMSYEDEVAPDVDKERLQNVIKAFEEQYQ